jgi:NADPH:quinone reductase-like Zn-dependent oxidoreductase
VLALVSGSPTELVRIENAPGPPAPGPGTVTVKVHHIAVNRGELHRLRDYPAGWRPGWDFAGEVVATHDDDGPRTGEFVSGFLLEGAWGQFINAPVNHLARLPREVDLATASCVPVAGVTAQRIVRLALSVIGDLHGRSVLVVGAAGGVGQFAIPIARRRGADVYGLTSSRQRFGIIEGAGATPVLMAQLDRHADRFDVVLESAGGRLLAAVVRTLARRGVIVTYGNSERTDTEFPTSAFYEREGRLLGYHLLNDVIGRPPRHDLSELFDLVARGDITVEHRRPVSWTSANDVLDALAARTVDGKAVLRVEHDA